MHNYTTPLGIMLSKALRNHDEEPCFILPSVLRLWAVWLFEFLCSESKLSKSCEERNSLLKLAEQLSDLVSPCEMIVQTPVPQSYESSLHNSHKLSHLLQLYDDDVL